MRILQILPVLAFAFSAQFLHAGKWDEVLGKAQGTTPPGSDEEVYWQPDVLKALAEAQESNKPVLVTWRCLPCKQCSIFDKDVLEGGPELTPLLQQFVTVRMTDAAQLDERIFPYRDFQDLDLSWWGYFLSPKGEVYGVFGGKDHVSDATRISGAAFINSLKRVLVHHYDPRRADWKIDGTVPNLSEDAVGPKDIEAFEVYAENRPWMAKQECVHCHQVGDLVHVESMELGTFERAQLTQRWPLPENVGIVVDRDDGLLVTEVEAGSAAAAAGIKEGDRLGMAGGRRLFGQADFRGVLHRASYGPDTIAVGWTRNGEPMFGELKTGDGWRVTENSWRKSVYEGVIGPHLGFFPIKGPNQGKGSMSFKPFMGPGPKQKANAWYPSGLRPNMEIVEVNGKSDDWDSRQFLAWFRLNHEVGDEVRIKVKGGKVFSKVLEKMHNQ